jgi:hypothetical protein
VFAFISQELDVVKLTRELDELKTDSRERDLRLQSLQSKVNDRCSTVSLVLLHAFFLFFVFFFYSILPIAAGEREKE